jgi:hypothetical protein
MFLHCIPTFWLQDVFSFAFSSHFLTCFFLYFCVEVTASFNGGVL